MQVQYPFPYPGDTSTTWRRLVQTEDRRGSIEILLQSLRPIFPSVRDEDLRLRSARLEFNIFRTSPSKQAYEYRINLGLNAQIRQRAANQAAQSRIAEPSSSSDAQGRQPAANEASQSPIVEAPANSNSQSERVTTAEVQQVRIDEAPANFPMEDALFLPGEADDDEWDTDQALDILFFDRPLSPQLQVCPETGAFLTEEQVQASLRGRWGSDENGA